MPQAVSSFELILDRWKEVNRKYKASWPQFEAANRNKLGEYASRGFVSPPPYAVTMEPTLPRLMPWESYLDSNLRMFATRRIVATQSNTLKDETRRDLAVHSAFEAAFLSDFIDFYIHAAFRKRFPGRELAQMAWRGVPFMALGILLGQLDRAKTQCELQVSALDKGLFVKSGEFPALELLLRICADFFDIPVRRGIVHIPAEGSAAFLLKNWRSDPEMVQPLLTALCDLHIERSFEQSIDHPIDFDDGVWLLFPVEVLAILEMRRLAGLPTVELEHPLIEKFHSLSIPMSSAGTDPLIRDVELRMRSQDFDEKSILHDLIY